MKRPINSLFFIVKVFVKKCKGYCNKKFIFFSKNLLPVFLLKVQQENIKNEDFFAGRRNIRIEIRKSGKMFQGFCRRKL